MSSINYKEVDLKNLSVDTDHFHYHESKNPLSPDSLTFVYKRKYKFEVIFDEDLGWRKTVKRQSFKHDQDKVYGRIIGESKIFRILQDNTTIEWIYKYIPFEHIII